MKGIIFDIDSTLFSHKENRIPDKTMEALRKLKEINFPRAICTSRFSFETDNLPEELFDYFDLLILGSGNEVFYKNQKMMVSELSKENIDKYMDYINDNDIEYRFTTVNGVMKYSPNIDLKLYKDITSLAGNPSDIGVYNDERLISLSYFNVNDKQMTELENLSDDVSIVEFEQSGQVCAKGINKAHSLVTMSEIYEIDIDKIIAVGDGLNDIEMIRQAGIGVAVGDAHPKLKKYADYISEDIEDGGIYNACNNLGIFD